MLRIGREQISDLDKHSANIIGVLLSLSIQQYLLSPLFLSRQSSCPGKNYMSRAFAIPSHVRE